MNGTETTDHDRYWSAVDEALDSGADPLANPLVQEWIAEHPGDGDELARLIRRVEIVTRARSSKPGRLTLAAAGVALAGAVVAAIGIHRSTLTVDVPARATRSCILQYSLEVVREGDDASTTVFTEPGRVARSQTALIGATIIVSSLEGQLP
jgi:hypothetical protein